MHAVTPLLYGRYTSYGQQFGGSEEAPYKRCPDQGGGWKAARLVLAGRGVHSAATLAFTSPASPRRSLSHLPVTNSDQQRHPPTAQTTSPLGVGSIFSGPTSTSALGPPAQPHRPAPTEEPRGLPLSTSVRCRLQVGPQRPPPATCHWHWHVSIHHADGMGHALLLGATGRQPRPTRVIAAQCRGELGRVGPFWQPGPPIIQLAAQGGCLKGRCTTAAASHVAWGRMEGWTLGRVEQCATNAAGAY